MPLIEDCHNLSQKVKMQFDRIEGENYIFRGGLLREGKPVGCVWLPMVSAAPDMFPSTIELGEPVGDWICPENLVYVAAKAPPLFGEADVLFDIGTSLAGVIGFSVLTFFEVIYQSDPSYSALPSEYVQSEPLSEEFNGNFAAYLDRSELAWRVNGVWNRPYFLLYDEDYLDSVIDSAWWFCFVDNHPLSDYWTAEYLSVVDAPVPSAWYSPSLLDGFIRNSGVIQKSAELKPASVSSPLGCVIGYNVQPWKKAYVQVTAPFDRDLTQVFFFRNLEGGEIAPSIGVIPCLAAGAGIVGLSHIKYGRSEALSSWTDDSGEPVTNDSGEEVLVYE